MALLSVLFDKPQRLSISGKDGREGGSERQLLILDMTNNISHQHEAEPTENPVELGADIADHVDVKQDVLSFEGIMSEAPITIEKTIIGNVAGALSAVSGLAGTALGTIASGAISKLGGELLGEPNNRVQDAHNTMLQIQKEAITTTIQTGLKTYSNMILTSYNPIENAQNGNSLVFTATFKEILIVQSESTIIPDLVRAEAQGALDTLNKGNQIAEVASDPVSRTAAATIFNVGG